jgi:patatin-like phospholipase/acyl hydrolase
VSSKNYSNSNHTEEVNSYNILSLDGGGIRGIITAIVIKVMEEEAFKIAVRKYNYTGDENVSP